MKNLQKRLVSLVFSMVLCFAFALPVQAASSYNANAALSYAKKHWNDGKGLCAEFISDCLKAGGCSGVYSKGASSMVNLLKKSNYGTWYKLTVDKDGYIPVNQNQGKLSPGDPIFFYCPKETDGNPYVHTVLYSGTDSQGDMKAYAHNDAMNNSTVRARYCGYCDANTISAVYVYHMNGGSTGQTTQDKTQSSSKVSVKTGKYYTLKNVGTGKYLNIYGNQNKNNANVDIYAADGTSGQDFKWTLIDKSQNAYTLTPRCATGRRVNIYGESAKNKSNVCLWSKTNHSTQCWIPEKVSGGYILRSANNKNYVLTATGNKNSSNVNIQKYSSGNKYQVWTSTVFNG